MLELQSVVKAYEGRPLLQGISFTLGPGETVCLLGSSGSGKSTLLRMIAGLEDPDAGRILYDGADLVVTPPHRRDFGLVFQDYGLFPHLNVRENVAFGLRMQNLPAAAIRARVADLLDQMNLTGLELRRVVDLSGGEQQRVALARALAPRPRLLMFDEPLGALDRSLKEELLEDLRITLQRSGIPAIYVTHDQEEAFSIADRLLLLHDGVIVREGVPAEVWEHPGSAWAARFLGIGNVLEAEVTEEGRFRTEAGEFDMACSHGHRTGERVPVVLRKAGGSGTIPLGLTVEAAVFRRDRYRFQARGGLVFDAETRPLPGSVVFVQVRVECLA